MFIDSHCHLNFPELYNSLDDVLNKMKSNQVDYAMCIGTALDNLELVTKIASENHNIFASVGIHPDEELDDFSGECLVKYLDNPKVVAIGETGLDYYLVQESINKTKLIDHQRFRLMEHIKIANTYDLPLVIHTRESFDDTVSILRDNDADKCGGVMHCFTEGVEEAKRSLDLGFYISISGIVTFKNALKVQEMAKYVPLDRLLIETDSPYLAPMPFRGKPNNPSYVMHTAQFLADLRHINIAEIAYHSSNNFFNLFKKAKPPSLIKDCYVNLSKY